MQKYIKSDSSHLNPLQRGLFALSERMREEWERTEHQGHGKNLESKADVAAMEFDSMNLGLDHGTSKKSNARC